MRKRREIQNDPGIGDCGGVCLIGAVSELGVALLRLGRDGGILWYSGALDGMIRMRRNGQPSQLTQCVIREDRPMVAATLSRTLRDRIPARCEARFVRQARKVRQGEIRLTPTSDGAFAVLIDVTERSTRLAFALESADQGLWDWDVVTGRVLYARPDASTGSSALQWRELHADNWYDQSHPHDRALARTQVERVLRGETDRFLTVVRMRYTSDAPWGHIESQGKVADTDASGKPTRLVGVFRNVTERLVEARQSRTRESAMAHTARVFSMEELTSSLSHELNQPLGALSNFVQAANRLLDRPKPDIEGARVAMRKAVVLAAQPAAIIRGLRSLVHRAVPQGENVDLRRLLEGVLVSVAPRAQAQHTQIDLQIPEEQIALHVDRVQIEQVLHNLITNSLDSLHASRRSGKRIGIVAEVTDRRLTVSVSDNGRGFASTAVEHMFRPFFSTKPDGMGLGLSISRSIMEAHGGRLWLAANGSGGTTMCFDLPMGDSINGQGKVKTRRASRRGR